MPHALKTSNGHGCFDGIMTDVVEDFKVFILIVKNTGGPAFDLERWIGVGRSGELELNLLKVVGVDVTVSPSPNEFTHIEVTLLGDHVREKRVARDVKRHPQKDVGAALIELATQTTFAAGRGAGCDIKLKKSMTRHERHLGQIGHVPSAHDHASRVGIGLQCFHEIGNLIDVLSIGRGPTSPLHPIHGPQISIFLGPFVPDGDPALLKPQVAARTTQEPQQLLNDRSQVDFLGGHQGKPLVQIKAHLVAKNTARARTSAVFLVHPVGEHMAHKVFVLARRWGAGGHGQEHEKIG